MSAMRSSRRSVLMSASARASGAPAQLWTPDPNARCWRQFGRSSRSSVGLLEDARIPVGGGGEQHHGGPRRDLDVADRGADPRHPEGALERGPQPQALLGEPRDEVSIVCAPAAGARAFSPSCWNITPSRRAVVSPPAENRFEAISMMSWTSGSEPSGKVACASFVITSSRGSRRRSSMNFVNRS